MDYLVIMVIGFSEASVSCISFSFCWLTSNKRSRRCRFDGCCLAKVW